MSVSTYRTNIERLQKTIADLEKQRAQEHTKIAKLHNEISSIDRSITKYTSISSIQSKQTQKISKLKTLGQAQDKLADYSKKIADKTAELNRNMYSLEKELEQAGKKQDSIAKTRRDTELKHSRAMTEEVQKQARIHLQMSKSPIVVDLAKLPSEIKVVIFAPNPLDPSLDQLRLDNEIREIAIKLRASDYRDSVKVIPYLATQPLDILQALNEQKPHIVHFSGHGNEDEIAFVDPDGNTKLVTKEAIVQVMQSMSGNIRLVLFNTCLSSQQAQLVTQYIDAAIGMKNEIGDEAARIFAAQFYSAIGFGESAQNAFNQAKSALMLSGIPEENTPELFTREGINADEIILVRPI